MGPGMRLEKLTPSHWAANPPGERWCTEAPRGPASCGCFGKVSLVGSVRWGHVPQGTGKGFPDVDDPWADGSKGTPIVCSETLSTESEE